MKEMQTNDPTSNLLPAIQHVWLKLDQYNSGTGPVQAITTILDPRYKLATFRHLSWQEERIQAAVKSMKEIYTQQYAPSIRSTPAPPDPSSEADKIDDYYFQAIFGSRRCTTSTNALSELDMYLEEPVEDRRVCIRNYFYFYFHLFINLAIFRSTLYNGGACILQRTHICR